MGAFFSKTPASGKEEYVALDGFNVQPSEDQEGHFILTVKAEHLEGDEHGFEQRGQMDVWQKTVAAEALAEQQAHLKEACHAALAHHAQQVEEAAAPASPGMRRQ